MGSFGELVLVLGDLHIPGRAIAIPESFKRMLVPNKMQHIVCTGNVGIDQYAELLSLAPSVHAVSGNYDDPSQQFPDHHVFEVGHFRIGVMHGHQILPYGSQKATARMRRKLGVDLLITGFTHRNEVRVQEGFYYINPGSMTGAPSAQSSDMTPSFVLLAVHENKLACYVYEIAGNGEVEVSKTEFMKESTPDNLGTNSSHLQNLLA